MMANDVDRYAANENSEIFCYILFELVGFIQRFEYGLSFIQHVTFWDPTVNYLIECMALHVHIISR
jgi:hypothetical protein